MDHYSILDHTTSTPAPTKKSQNDTESQASAGGSAGRASASGVSVRDTASSVVPQPSPSLPHPAEDGAKSLVGMAQRDLDAALQLLAERAQYITSASGAAIALRRSTHNDMLCRASAGSNAPELGTLLSAESGLSGESVRTREPLRCDDAESDPRVNRQSCRELGIASVVVMPIVSEDQVLGVFELFSGRPNAFDERDIAALQRLGEMVETAVMHALAAAVPIGPEMAPRTALSTDNPPIEVAVEAVAAQPKPATKLNAAEAEHSGNSAVESVAERLVEQGIAEPGAGSQIPTAISASPSDPRSTVPNVIPDTPAAEDLPLPGAPPAVQPSAAPQSSPAKKIIWWSAPAPDNSAVQPQAQMPDPIPVPPALKGVHRCQACGFPVSEGRVLCVECEEKKWRGTPHASSSTGLASPQPAANQPSVVEAAQRDTGAGSVHSAVTRASAAAESAVPGFVLSAGAQPSQSWLATNMYVIAATCVVAIVLAVIAWMR